MIMRGLAQFMRMLASVCVCVRLLANACVCVRLCASACECLRGLAQFMRMLASVCVCVRLCASACECLRLCASVCVCLRMLASARVCLHLSRVGRLVSRRPRVIPFSRRSSYLASVSVILVSLVCPVIRSILNISSPQALRRVKINFFK